MSTALSRLAAHHGIVPSTARLTSQNGLWYLEGEPANHGATVTRIHLSPDAGQTADDAAFSALVHAALRAEVALNAALSSRLHLVWSGYSPVVIAAADQVVARYRAALLSLLGLDAGVEAPADSHTPSV